MIKSRETMERDLRTAIADGHFEVYYQPKVSARDWTVTGVEALVRFNHPERGLVGPGDFIEIAEMTGLIYDIGLIVLEEAICQCAEWHRAYQSTEVSINVSIEQFRNTEFSNLVISILNEHECPADLVTIEITETIAHTNIVSVSDHIKALRAVGVRIAIDDFGTGYSNLAQLTGLKFDILKVDRSFVSGIDSEGKAREVSRAIIQLGKNLGCRVVVEGTETPGQVAAAAQLGCDEIQGFFFSKPMKRSDFDTWKQLRASNPVRKALDSIVAGGLTKIIPPQGRLTAS
ncbi:EAL domain-containing protein [Hoeflea alexandrii]|uniref:putative bifunctional diguanylate cyclase/phosphodiesterase n=1 Tax=Hoeflea alexandrii TaxID=288436 RepID=UPI002271D72F|nr:EAL domain-containing protein [Hoeflea alexandrii]MCY0154422.1 EAL domain-containing protein [Hoeflea alexandrii]